MTSLPLLMLWISIILSTTTTTKIVVVAQEPVFELHGAGAAAPCIRLIMDLIMDRAKSPLRLTYREIANATAAQTEYRDSVLMDTDTGTTTTTRLVVDFGAGHSPLNQFYFNELKSLNRTVLHFPHVLSAVGLYHSIDSLSTTTSSSSSSSSSDQHRLNLTSCLIAQIFTREITTWNDPAIRKENPLLATLFAYDDDAAAAIVVLRDNLASPVTQGLTEYLHVSCPEKWSEVGDDIVWPSDVINCATDMATCLGQHTNAIGFSDVSHADAAFLKEVPLPNKEGRYHTSQQARQLGGMEAALMTGNGPSLSLSLSAQDYSFATFTLIYQSGPDTWPIVLMNYVYVAADLSALSRKAQGLMMAFLQALYEIPYVYQCQSLLGLIPVPDHVRTLGLQGIQLLKDTNPDARLWDFERILISEGASSLSYHPGDLVLSERRQSFAHQQLSALASDVAVLKQTSGLHVTTSIASTTTATTAAALVETITALQNDNVALQTLVTNLMNRVVQLETTTASGGDGSTTNGGPSPTPQTNVRPIIDMSVLDDDTAILSAAGLPVYDDDAEGQLRSALTLASISFTLWAIYFVWKTWRFFLKP